MRTPLIAIAGLAWLAAGAQAGPCPLPGQQPQTSVELFFGLSTQDAPRQGVLAEPEWTAFESDVVARAFPRGFTSFDANGAWLDAAHHRTAHEKTKVVLAVLPPDEVASAVEGAVRGFKALLPNQQSVGVVTRDVCAAF